MTNNNITLLYLIFNTKENTSLNSVVGGFTSSNNCINKTSNFNSINLSSSLLINDLTNGFVKSLFSIPVQHCFSSYGIILELNKINIQLSCYNNSTFNNNFNNNYDNFKIVYSGDCRPSNSLIYPGMNCDILIHEATFDDTMLDDAIKKKHSTITEATKVRFFSLYYYLFFYLLFNIIYRLEKK